MARNLLHPSGFPSYTAIIGELNMRGILLWLVGLPIPIIILLYLFNVL